MIKNCRLVIDKLSDDEETSQQSDGTPFETPTSKTTTSSGSEITPSSQTSTTTSDSKSDVKTSSEYSSPIVNTPGILFCFRIFQNC